MNGVGITVFQSSSPETAGISHLFLIVLLVCGIILAIVVVMVGAALIRFRQRAGGGEPRPFFGNRKLEIFWTIGPMLIVIWLFVLTAHGMRQADPPVNREPDVIVMGHQWWWEVRYPQTGVVTANEIHIPSGSQRLVRLESADVIHNFWVPALARKIQMVPGLTNHVWLETDTPGNFGGICAEYCGAQHSWMHLTVIVEPPAVFKAWLQGQENTATIPAIEPAQDGWKLFQTLTCNNCHSIHGVNEAVKAAPDLTHLAGRQTLGGGVLANTETNLFRWLKNPQAFKPGCLMPDLKLTDGQAGALTAYLETLK